MQKRKQFGKPRYLGTADALGFRAVGTRVPPSGEVCCIRLGGTRQPSSRCPRAKHSSNVYGLMFTIALRGAHSIVSP